MPAPQPASTVLRQQTRAFPDDCKAVLHTLRGALTEALCAAKVDPARPQEVARQLGLHRNLTWKLSKIIKSTNAFAAVAHVPGRSGMEILLTALRRAAIDDARIAAVESARAEFDRLVVQHAGDRATLDLVASGFVPQASQRESLAQARRLAFRGNSATWRVQAKALMSIKILAPAADDPERVDLVQIHGIIELRRLRPDAAWPLFRREIWDGPGSVTSDDSVPIEPGAAPDGVPLLLDYCSPELPQLNVLRGEKEIEYELPGGPVGRLGELTVVYGVKMPSIGTQFATADERVCELGTNMLTPAELLHCDVLVHDSLDWAKRPRAEVVSLLEGRPVHSSNRRASTLLVGEGALHELGLGIDTMSTPHIPRYNELLAHAFACLGWDESAFRGFRLKISYPPIPAVAMVSMDLARRS